MKAAATISILSVLHGVQESLGKVHSGCDLHEYYDGLFQRDVTTWTRDNIEDLVRQKHAATLPFYGSKAGTGDILEALISLDGNNDGSIRLYYSNLDAPIEPLGRNNWVPEHICPIFITGSVARHDFDAAFSDLHNIRPVHPSLHESVRGTEYFGVCPTCHELIRDGSGTCICGDFFQPPENARGAVARTWLYMQLRYPGLQLSSCHLEQLLAWHHYHPPSYVERLRNKNICEQFQGNRNPFVDFPDLAFNLVIHESSCEHGFTYGDDIISQHLEDLLAGSIVADSDNTNDVDKEFDQTIMEQNNPDDDGGFMEQKNPDDDGGYMDQSNPDDDDGFTVTAEAKDKSGNKGTEFQSTAEKDDSRKSIWENIFSPKIEEEGSDFNVVQDAATLCSEIAPGDIYFYVLQSGTTRVGLFPLVNLRQGLELYLTTSLAVQGSMTTERTRYRSEISPDAPLLKLQLPRDTERYLPFGYGQSLLFDEDWQELTVSLSLRGAAVGGDELFLFCSDDNQQMNLITAITTHGEYADSGDIRLEPNTPGIIILPTPMDYFVYNGPSFADQNQYKAALQNPDLWLGFDLWTNKNDGDPQGDRSSLRDQIHTNLEILETETRPSRPSSNARDSSCKRPNVANGFFLLSLPLLLWCR